MAESFDSDLYDIVAEACLYGENVPQAIQQKYKLNGKKVTMKEAQDLHKEVLKDKKFQEYLQDYVAIEKASLFEDTRETILLKLNRVISKANREGKYDTVVKTLDRISKMLAIEDKQMEFKVTISFEPTEKTNLELLNPVNTGKKI